MKIDLLYYLLGALVAIYLILLVVLSLWVYMCTKDIDLIASLGAFEEARKGSNLTRGQALLLNALGIFRRLTIGCGVLVVVLDLIVLIRR